MRTWDLLLELDPALETPLYLQIADALSRAIRKGRLKPGAPLPSSRALAETLKVHRNTVVAAYRELGLEGWIKTRKGGTTYVEELVPDGLPLGALPTAPNRPLGFELASASPLPSPPVRGLLACQTGMPDPRLLPMEALARAYRRALQRSTRRATGAEDLQGSPELRAALAEMLTFTRGMNVTPESLLVTLGGPPTLALLARALVGPGDLVAVEALSSPHIWDAFRRAGAEILPIPVDDGGMDVAALETLVLSKRVRTVYATTLRQYPTTVVLEEGRRKRLLSLARDHRFALVEDAYEGEFHYEGRPPMPLASLDQAGVTIFVGTLSKLFAQRLRLGYFHAPPPLIQRLRELRGAMEGQGDPVLELAVTELLRDGEHQRHVHRMNRIGAERRDMLCQLLQERLGSVLDVRLPSGGTALWAKVTERIDVDLWATRALAQGVAFQPGRHFRVDGGACPYLRIGFASHSGAELEEVVKRMEKALPTR